MRRYYENLTDNVAFERCIDLMSKMILKYGSKVLEQQKQTPPEDDIPLKNSIKSKKQKAA